MADNKADVRAALLTGTITASSVEPTALAERRGPALYEAVRRHFAPLNLDAPRFFYLIREDGRIEPVREAGRCCRSCSHQRASLR